jgi:hypothetical protein
MSINDLGTSRLGVFWFARYGSEPDSEPVTARVGLQNGDYSCLSSSAICDVSFSRLLAVLIETNKPFAPFWPLAIETVRTCKILNLPYGFKLIWDWTTTKSYESHNHLNKSPPCKEHGNTHFLSLELCVWIRGSDICDFAYVLPCPRGMQEVRVPQPCSTSSMHIAS